MDTSSALERLVRDYGERAFQFAYRLTGNIDQAKEVVQETYYRVLKNWDKYDSSQPLENWFFSILRHVFLDCVRSCEHSRFLSLDAATEESEESALDALADDRDERILDALERQESAQAVKRALGRLTVEHRAVLTLCDLESMPYDQIAAVIGCPIGTVRSRVNRARSALRALLLRGAEVR